MESCEDCSSLQVEGCLQPGAARYGNFPDYYRFNPSNERMKWITTLQKCDFITCTSTDRTRGHNQSQGETPYVEIKPICVLDIGCNTGVSAPLPLEVLHRITLHSMIQIILLIHASTH